MKIIHKPQNRTICTFDDEGNCAELQYDADDSTLFLSVWRSTDDYDDDSRVIELHWFTFLHMALRIAFIYLTMPMRRLFS